MHDNQFLIATCPWSAVFTSFWGAQKTPETLKKYLSHLASCVLLIAQAAQTPLNHLILLM
jgi:hypothetical protein